jgi:hypothetical protein
LRARLRRESPAAVVEAIYSLIESAKPCGGELKA